MRTSSKLKNLLIRIIIAVILFLAKQYLNLDFINDLVDKIIIIIISALLLDFNTFSLEITKVFFNGNNGDEGEGSNRQNNNTPNQDNSTHPLAFEEAPEVERQIEGMLEELIEDEEDKVFMAEETRLRAQNQAREDSMFINQLALDEKRADIDKRIRDFEDLKNQSESDESMIPVLADIKRKIVEDIEALNENTRRINHETRASNAEIEKLLLDRAKIAARRLENSINERNSE
jgi:hypothetical protein